MLILHRLKLALWALFVLILELNFILLGILFIIIGLPVIIFNHKLFVWVINVTETPGLKAEQIKRDKL